MLYKYQNKVNAREFITNCLPIREKLPATLANIENNIDKLNKLTDNNFTIIDFIENVPQNTLLKVILLFAQNDEEIVRRFLDYKNSFIKETTENDKLRK